MFPRLTINLQKIADNTERMVARCAPLGIEIMGVTKGVCGDPDIARVFVDRGVPTLGDARLDNLERLRTGGLDVPLWLLRSPAPQQAAQCVELASGSVQSEAATIEAVADQAHARGLTHRVLLMLDLDTGREGIAPGRLADIIRLVDRAQGLALEGVGLYFDFKATASEQQKTLDIFYRNIFPYLSRGLIWSGGASNVLHHCLVSDTVPAGVNHLRVGTAPLLGLATSDGPRPIDGWDRDTFLLEAPVIEVKQGSRELLISLGQVDAPIDYLYPVEEGIRLERASSDHLVVSSEREYAPGELVGFRLGYYAMNRLMASPYTARRYTR